jgi:hypothetical protein
MTRLEAMKIIYKRSPHTKVAIMSGSSLGEAIKAQIEDLA